MEHIQFFDYIKQNIVIFDLEATCWEEFKHKEKLGSEIIEIGAVKINPETAEIISEFNIFVKPTEKPVLSDYCKNLTTINQENVDSAKFEFWDAIDEFSSWVGTDVDCIMSWGFYDKKQILREASRKDFDRALKNRFISLLEKTHFNMKLQFQKINKTKGMGMKDALNMLGLSLDGTHHRAISDVMNMAKIYSYYKLSFFKM